MANREHLDILLQGVDVWNQWKKEHPRTQPDLSHTIIGEADLSGADLSRAHLIGTYLSDTHLHSANLSKAHLHGASLSSADLSQANLTQADLSDAHLYSANLTGAYLQGALLTNADLVEANLSFADLREAHLSGANLIRAVLSKADLSRADLSFAYLREANFSGADLSYADLSCASMVGTNLKEANLSGCSIFGISAWNIDLEGAIQSHLILTEESEPTITVDNLEVAQFIYLLLNNQKIRDVINTITSKVVLILGRFTPDRKAILDALRNELRKQNYSPVLFDFEKPGSRNITETMSTLAHMARFVIADLTDPNSIPQELYAIVPTLAVPVQPLLEASKKAYSMFDDLKRTYHWVLPIYRYTDLAGLLATLQEDVIDPAEQKAQELEKR